MNTGLLEGMACPECHSEGPFKIEVKKTVMVHDDTVDEDDQMCTSGCEWKDDSYCECDECGHHGTVNDFRRQVDAE